MPWLRSGDNAATHPIVMRVVSLVRSLTDVVLERDVAVNEVYGFVVRCSQQAAAHTTDYVIDEGTTLLMGGARTDRLVQLAIDAGYFTKKRQRGVTVYMLVDDPEFIHMRTRAEIDRDRQRKSDNANKAIILPVRLRDGDECRYCGVLVNWRDRKSNRGGTYDHRNPLGTTTTVDTLVVACNACNAGRSDDPAADDRYPLRPAPAEPFYSVATTELLLKAGYRVHPSEDQRPGRQPGTATATRQPAGHRTSHPTSGRAPDSTANRPQAHAQDGSADRQHPGSGFAGTGRDGTGGSSLSPPQRGPNRRRGRRGGQRNRTPGAQP